MSHAEGCDRPVVVLAAGWGVGRPHLSAGVEVRVLTLITAAAGTHLIRTSGMQIQ